jgi:leucine efflux protein
MTYLATLVLAGAKLAAAFRRHRRLAIGGTGAVGALFVAFGMKLATASLE